MSDATANIFVNINTQKASAQLRALTSEISAFNRTAMATNTAAATRQQALNRAFMDAANATGMFNARMVPMMSSVDRFSTALDKNKLSLGQYTRYATSQLPGMSKVFTREFDTINRVATDRVKKLQTQFTALGKSAKGLEQAMTVTPTMLGRGYATSAALAAQKQQIFNKLIDDGSTKLLNWGKNTQWAGRQLMVGFSLPLATLGSIAAKTFMELDKATLQLERVYGDLNTSTAEVERNSDAIKQLGIEYTKYGIAVKDTISIGARAAATGATNESLMAATEQTLRFATLGQIEYGQALDTTISLQTAFGISNDELAQKIDFLNAVENQTILTIQDMSLAIPRVATVIKGLGGSVEDLAVMMTAMREGGVSAENAANALKSGLASLINPTDRATASLQAMGVNLTDIIQKNRGNLMGLIKDFGSAINAMDSFSRQQVLEQVFGKYQYARMSALFTNITSTSGQAARAMDLAGRSAQELASISDKELSKISETTTVKFQAAMEQLKISIAPLGEAFLKGVMPIMDVLAKIANAFNNLPDGVKNAIAVVTGVVAGLGPVFLMTLGLIGNGIANLIKGFQLIRRTIARLRGQGEAFQYLATAELEASAAADALEGNLGGTTKALLIQAQAVSELTTLYERLATSMGVAGRGGVAGRARSTVVRAAGSRSIVTGPNGMPMANGGIVPGTGNKDTVPALLTPGESVVTKSATQKYGPVIAAMNAGKLPGYATGIVSVGQFDIPMQMARQSSAKTVAAIANKTIAELVEDGIQMDVALDKVTQVLRDFAATGKVINQKVAQQLMKENLLTRSTRNLQATHLTPDIPVSDPRVQEFIAKQNNPALTEFAARHGKYVKGVSALTATLPQSLNLGLRQGISSESFMKQWAVGGKNPLLNAAQAMDDTIKGDDAAGKALQQMSKEISERSIQIAKDAARDKVLQSDVDQATSEIIQKYKSVGGSATKAAAALDKAANTIGQLRIQMPKAVAQRAIQMGVLSENGSSVINKGGLEVARNSGIRPASNIGGLAVATAQQQADALQAAMVSRGPAIGAQTMAAVGEGMLPEAAALGGMAGKEWAEQFVQSSVATASNQPKAVLRGSGRRSPAPIFGTIGTQEGKLYGESYASAVKAAILGTGSVPPMPGMTPADAAKAGQSAAAKYADAVKKHILGQGPAPIMPSTSNKPVVYGRQFSEMTARRREFAGRSATTAKAAMRSAKAGAAGVGNAALGVRNAYQSAKAAGAVIRDELKKSATQAGAAYAQSAEKVRQQQEKRRQYGYVPNARTGADSAFSRGGRGLGGPLQLPYVPRSFGKVMSDSAERMSAGFKSARQSATGLGQTFSSIGKSFKSDFKSGFADAGKSFKRSVDQMNKSFVEGSKAVRVGSGLLKESLINAAKTTGGVLGIGGGSKLSAEERAARNQRMQGRTMGAGMMLSMASMVPMMAQDKNGKFMGMDAGTASMGMMGGGMLLSMVGMVPAPILALIAAVGAAGLAFKVFRDNIDKTAVEMANLGANIGGAANATKNLATMMGLQTPAERQKQVQIGLSATDLASQQYGEFQNMLESEAGQKFLNELKNATAPERFAKLQSYLQNAIATGLMDPAKAELFGKTVGLAIGDAVVGSAVPNMIKGVKQGSEQMLKLAQQREAAVAGTQATKNVAAGGQVSYQDASTVIGSGFQIIGDFSNAIALANEEYNQGKMSFKDYRDVVEQARTNQEKYNGIMLDAIKNTSDFGGTMAAVAAQFGAIGFTPEQTAAAEAAAAPRTNFYDTLKGFSANLGEWALGAIDEGWAQSYKDFAGQSAAHQQRKDQSAANMLSMGEAVQGGMAPETATALMNYINDNPESKAAKAYAEMSGKGRGGYESLSMAGLASSIDAYGVPGLKGANAQETATLSQQFLNAAQQYAANVGTVEEFQTYFNSIPEAKKTEAFKSFKAIKSPETQKMLTGSYGRMNAAVGGDTAYAITQSKSYQNALAQNNKAAVNSITASVEKAKQVFGDNAENVISFVLNEDPPDLQTQLPKLTQYATDLQENVPDVVLKTLGIDINNPQDLNKYGPMAEDLGALTPILNELPEGVKEIGAKLMIDENGNPLSPEDFAKASKRVKTAYDNLKSGKKSVKKEAIITLLQEAKGPDGKKMTPEEAAASYQSLIDTYGEQTIINLPQDIITQVITIQSEIKGLDEAIATTQAAIDALGPDASKDERVPLLRRRDALLAAKGAAITKQRGAVAAGQVRSGNGQGGAGSGSGGANNPIKDMITGFVDQAKMYLDAGATAAKLASSKYQFSKKLFAQEKANQGLIGILRRTGLSENVIAALIEQGPDAMKRAIKKYQNNAKAVQEMNRMDYRSTITSLIGGARERVFAATRSRTAATALGRRGLPQEVIQTAMNDQKFINILAQKGGKEKNKAIDEYLKKLKQEWELNQEIARAQNPIQAQMDDLTKAHDQVTRSLDKQIEKEQDKIDAIQKEIDAIQELNDQDQLRIRSLEREKEMLQRQIDSIDKQNEADQRTIDSIKRQDELRNRVADALSHELDIMSQKENDIQKAYDERVKALDAIAAINDHIINQQKNQINLAGALTSGDIAAAATARQEMQAADVQYAQDQMRKGLQTGMENQIASLTTEGGLTREQAEKRIRDIQEQSYQTSLKIRDIEDQIYNRNSYIQAIKDKIYEKDMLIRDISDVIYNRESDINTITETRLKPQQKILSALDDEKKKADQMFNDRIDELQLLDDQNNMISSQRDNVAALADQWYAVAKQIKNAKDIAKKADAELGPPPSRVDYKTNEDYAAAVKSWQSKKRKIAADQASAISTAMDQGNAWFDAVNFATGGVAGVGGRDSVPSMLTPGEYVIRKAAVQKYGSAMFDKINMGSYEIPKYNIGQDVSPRISSSNIKTNVNAPTYNAYSVNVNVPNTNASPDAIANRVAMKLADTGRMNVRSIRGN